MNQSTSCESIPLRDVLKGDCRQEMLDLAEAHLEECTTCQSRLSQLAADDLLWSKAASHLSTINEIQLPVRLTQRMDLSGSMLIPTLEQVTNDEGRSESSKWNDTGGGDRQWMRILDPPSHPEMLGQIDQFEIESKIGQGGMGIVLKGHDRELNRSVAIKVLAPHLASNGTARRRFAREAQAAAAVMHANVVPIYSVNQSADRPYIVMQLVPGHSLESLVQEQGPLLPLDVVRVSVQVASGLAAAHKIGLIHRDVKPGNVLVERDVKRVMITDFGLARAVDDAGMTQTGWLAGTPHYMSPEQSKGDDLDLRTDLFSLGSLMYFLATGREPFRGEKPYAVIQKIINDQQTDPMDINVDIPWMLADIIEKLLEKDPRNRFQSAAELVSVLEQYLAHLQQPTHTKPPKKILTQRRKHRRMGWAIGFCTALIVAAVTSLAISEFGSFGTRSPSDAIEGSALIPPATSRPFVSPPVASNLWDAIPSSDPVPPSPAFGFQFDSEFSRQLDSFASDLGKLEQSLQDSIPLKTNFESPRQYFNPDPTEFESIDSTFRALETKMKSDDVARDMKRLSNENPIPSPINRQSGVRSKAITQPQPPLKGKPDEN